MPLLIFPLRFFKSIEAILNSFVWGAARHKLSWQALKNPTDFGGASLPDFILYYLAAQLSHFFYLDKTNRDHYLSLVCSPSAPGVTHPFQILFRDLGGAGTLGNRKGLLYHHCKIWEVVGRRLKVLHTHSHTPLWDNPGLCDLLTVPDQVLWLQQGVRYLSDICHDTVFEIAPTS